MAIELQNSSTNISPMENSSRKYIVLFGTKIWDSKEFNVTEILTKRRIYTWTIEKSLTESDINGLSRLLLEKNLAEQHIMSYLSADDQVIVKEGNEGLPIQVYDHDMNTEHNMVFKRMKSTRSYVFNGGWVKEFVTRRGLKQGDKIGLFWGIDDHRLHFSVLLRAFL